MGVNCGLAWGTLKWGVHSWVQLTPVRGPPAGSGFGTVGSALQGPRAQWSSSEPPAAWWTGHLSWGWEWDPPHSTLHFIRVLGVASLGARSENYCSNFFKKLLIGVTVQLITRFLQHMHTDTARLPSIGLRCKGLDWLAALSRGALEMCVWEGGGTAYPWDVVVAVIYMQTAWYRRVDEMAFGLILKG